MDKTTTIPGAQPQLDLKATKPLVCENCNGELFGEFVMFRTVSALLTKNGKEALLPIQVMGCVKCHTVPDQFIPSELKSIKKSSVLLG